MLPGRGEFGKILELYDAKQAISCIMVRSVTENELFMIIKLVAASSAVSPL